MRLSTRARRAWERWEAAAGDWRGWAVGLPLLGPGLDELEPLAAQQAGHGPRTRPPAGLLGGAVEDPRADRLAARLAAHIAETPTFVVLDLPPVLGVRVAARLAARRLARPLPLLGRWPYAEAILPARPLLDTLLLEASRLPANCPAPSLVMILDADRDRPLPDRSSRDRRVDNRYQLFPEDLPDPARLRAAGIARALDVRRRGQPVPPPLSTLVYPAYTAAGLMR